MGSPPRFGGHTIVDSPAVHICTKQTPHSGSTALRFEFAAGALCLSHEGQKLASAVKGSKGGGRLPTGVPSRAQERSRRLGENRALPTEPSAPGRRAQPDVLDGQNIWDVQRVFHPSPAPFTARCKKRFVNTLSGFPPSPSPPFVRAPCARALRFQEGILLFTDPPESRTSALGSRPRFPLTPVCFSPSQRLQNPSRRERGRTGDYSSLPTSSSGKSSGSAKVWDLWALWGRGRKGLLQRGRPPEWEKGDFVGSFCNFEAFRMGVGVRWRSPCVFSTRPAMLWDLSIKFFISIKENLCSSGWDGGVFGAL